MPLTLLPAAGPILERILGDTYLLWNDGLSRENYGRFWAAQLKTTWGAAHLDRVALIDGPHVLSSAKRYDLALRLDGRIRRALGIGAVFTTPAFRGQGFGRELLSRVLDDAVTHGYEFAMLFSEIEPSFYERLDFVPVPLVECRLAIDCARAGAPAMLVRAGHDRDLAHIVELSATWTAPARLALHRSEDFVQYGLTKKRLLSGLGPAGLRATEFLVVEEAHQPAAYLVCTAVSGGCWMIEEAGDRDPRGARLGALLQAMLARQPAEAQPEIRAWWPHALRPPQVRVVDETSSREVLMIRPLRDRTLPLPPLSAEDVAYWHADYF
jgi:GNAT superfamily N-acetyltransferase